MTRTNVVAQLAAAERALGRIGEQLASPDGVQGGQRRLVERDRSDPHVRLQVFGVGRAGDQQHVRGPDNSST
ncbi:hypothetical protein [Streptomyces cellulosae]|uniref:Uncharacterized protein n=1 Tax=Streptomyces cellulosae TaxID=1968 RepID=A0ABW7Y943_STRCE